LGAVSRLGQTSAGSEGVYIPVLMAAAVGNLSKITPDQKCFARSPASSRARKITHVAPKFNKRLYKCANLVRAKAVSGGLNSAPVPNLREVKASASSTMDFTDGSKSNLDMPEILSTQQDKPRPAFHLHFGAGRLGMGLVFPAIVAGKVPFAIMQPPFEEFNPILAERPERVGVTINGKAAMEGGLRVVYDEDVRAEECALPGSGSLVLTDAASAQWVLMAKAATSFTCSVGPALPKILGPLLSQLPELPEELQPVLYACENDHKAVEQLKELVAGKVSVVPCMVDRICSSRSIEASSIVVNTEPWRGNIIPQAPMAELSKPAVGEGAVPLAGSSVFVPRTMEVADYRYQRKIYFVNHMHTTLALMTLVRHRQANNRSVEEMLDYDGACVPLKLLNPETVPEMQKLELKAWMVAQILMLVHEFTVPLMMDVRSFPSRRSPYPPPTRIVQLTRLTSCPPRTRCARTWWSWRRTACVASPPLKTRATACWERASRAASRVACCQPTRR